MMKLFFLTTAAGKRLIGKGMAAHPAIRTVLRSGVLVIIAGTTNGYVAEEILAKLGKGKDFSRRRFFRGVTPSPAWATTEQGRLPDQSEFPGDVVINRGVWQKGRTIFDVVDSLKEGDSVAFNGEYEWNAKGGVIHWTHRDPQGSHVAGWLKHKGNFISEDLSLMNSTGKRTFLFGIKNKPVI